MADLARLAALLQQFPQPASSYSDRLDNYLDWLILGQPLQYDFDGTIDTLSDCLMSPDDLTWCPPEAYGDNSTILAVNAEAGHLYYFHSYPIPAQLEEAIFTRLIRLNLVETDNLWWVFQLPMMQTFLQHTQLFDRWQQKPEVSRVHLVNRIIESWVQGLYTVHTAPIEVPPKVYPWPYTSGRIKTQRTEEDILTLTIAWNAEYFPNHVTVLGKQMGNGILHVPKHTLRRLEQRKLYRILWSQIVYEGYQINGHVDDQIEMIHIAR